MNIWKPDDQFGGMSRDAGGEHCYNISDDDDLTVIELATGSRVVIGSIVKCAQDAEILISNYEQDWPFG